MTPYQGKEDRKVNPHLQGEITLTMDRNIDKRVVKSYHHQEGPQENLNREGVMILLKKCQDLKDHDQTTVNPGLRENDTTLHQVKEDEKANLHLPGSIIQAMDQIIDKEVVKTYHHQEGPTEILKQESVMILLRMKIMPKRGIHPLIQRGLHD